MGIFLTLCELWNWLEMEKSYTLRRKAQEAEVVHRNKAYRAKPNVLKM